MKSKKKLLIIIISAILAVIAVFAFINKKNGESLPVDVTKAEIKAVTDTYIENGTLGSGENTLIMSEVSGKILSVDVEMNQKVNAGDVLFRIDSSDFDYQKSMTESELAGYEAQISKSRAGQVLATAPSGYIDDLKEQLDAAESAMSSAKINYDAAQKLYAAGTMPELEMESKKAAFDAANAAYDRIKLSYESALNRLKNSGMSGNNIDREFFRGEENQLQAQIDAGRSTISHINTQIGKCVVRAQQSGIITALPVKEMTSIQAGQAAATITSAAGMGGVVEAEADVLTTAAPYLKVGDTVEVTLTLRGSDEKYTGKISEIYDYATQGTSALGLNEYRVHVKVAMDAGQNLSGKDGYGVNMKFNVFHSDKSTVVPSSAVFKDDGEYFVYLIKDGKAFKQKIEVDYQSSSDTVIKSGLKEGTEVINKVDTEGLHEGAEVIKK